MIIQYLNENRFIIIVSYLNLDTHPTDLKEATFNENEFF